MTISTVLCALFEIGICSTVIHEVSAPFQTEPVHIRNLVRTASWLYWGAYLFLVLGIYSFAPLLVQKWINVKTMDTSTAIWMLRVLGIAALLGLPRRFNIGALTEKPLRHRMPDYTVILPWNIADEIIAQQRDF